MDLMDVVQTVLNLPRDQRTTYIAHNCIEYAHKYPQLFRKVATSDDFDLDYFRKILEMSKRQDRAAAEKEVVDELQAKYVTPIVDQLNKAKSKE